VEIWRRCKEKLGFKLYHWVLMSNHIHLVIIEDQAERRMNEKDFAGK
jgi:REP element-mobilizing transposase RayT